jgi:hypothetical protein
MLCSKLHYQKVLNPPNNPQISQRGRDAFWLFGGGGASDHTGRQVRRASHGFGSGFRFKGAHGREIRGLWFRVLWLRAALARICKPAFALQIQGLGLTTRTLDHPLCLITSPYISLYVPLYRGVQREGVCGRGRWSSWFSGLMVEICVFLLFRIYD